jgi:VCBS repeat-containing protein
MEDLDRMTKPFVLIKRVAGRPLGRFSYGYSGRWQYQEKNSIHKKQLQAGHREMLISVKLISISLMTAIHQFPR